MYSFTAYVTSVNVNPMSRRDFITGSLFSAKIIKGYITGQYIPKITAIYIFG